MAQRQHIVAEIGDELRGLGRDQGARLEQVLWLLQNQRRKIPDDPQTISAYNYALVRAGKATEARAEALYLHRLLSPNASPLDILNSTAGLVDAGLCPFAQQRIDQLLQRADVEPERVHALARSIAVRFGELEWYRARFVMTPVSEAARGSAVIAYLEEHTSLARWWGKQQRALEHSIGERVAEAMCGMFIDPEGGATRVVLDYYTDASSLAEVESLYQRAMDGLMAIYETHPDGPGAFLGEVVVDVHGPEIPLQELK